MSLRTLDLASECRCVSLGACGAVVGMQVQAALCGSHDPTTLKCSSEASHYGRLFADKHAPEHRLP